MTWHYAAAGERRGPIDDAELDRLIEAGTISADTLVWRAGMAEWRPLREARAGLIVAEAAAQAAAVAQVAAQQPEPARPRPDLEAEFARTAGRTFSPVSAISRGISLVMARPGPTIGISALIIAMMIAAGFVPCVGSLVQIAVTGPLVAAWYAYFLRHIRNQAATLDNVFAVFSSPDLMHLVAVHVIVWIGSMVLLVPFVVLIFFTTLGTVAAGAAAANGDAPAFVMGPLTLLPLVAFVPVFAILLYVTMAFMFAPVLILDRGHAFWPAMKLSMRVVNRRLLPTLALLLLAGLVALAGLLALCLGIFVAMPVIMASYAYAYEDLFGEAAA